MRNRDLVSVPKKKLADLCALARVNNSILNTTLMRELVSETKLFEWFDPSEEQFQTIARTQRLGELLDEFSAFCANA